MGNLDTGIGRLFVSFLSQVVNSTGPSGPNMEYVFNLAKSMRKFFPQVHDEHLFELEKKCLKLLNESNGVLRNGN